MGIRLLKSFSVFFLILAGFVLILLLPREAVVTSPEPFKTLVEYPFGIDVYIEKIKWFANHFITHGGFGEGRIGMPIVEETKRYFVRSLQIVIPAFFISMILGISLGILQFINRNKLSGRVHAAFSWIFASIPDFFLYITIQYLLIKLIQNGLPKFNLYGNDHWYSFVLPLIALTIFPLIHMSKMTAAALETESSNDYLRTVFAKGLGKKKALTHMLWNCWPTILNQAQLVMLYILSSLPIIEKLSGYKGAGYNLLDKILGNDEVSALALMLPFLVLMFLTIVIAQITKAILVPIEEAGDSK